MKDKILKISHSGGLMHPWLFLSYIVYLSVHNCRGFVHYTGNMNCTTVKHFEEKHTRLLQPEQGWNIRTSYYFLHDFYILPYYLQHGSCLKHAQKNYRLCISCLWVFLVQLVCYTIRFRVVVLVPAHSRFDLSLYEQGCAWFWTKTPFAKCWSVQLFQTNPWNTELGFSGAFVIYGCWKHLTHAKGHTPGKRMNL